jgi:thiol-disulfide isomerase/thioredoxin
MKRPGKVRLLFIWLLSFNANAQHLQLLIYHPAKDSLLAKKTVLLDFPEIQPSRINDTTLAFNYQTAFPGYLTLLLDEPTEWMQWVWADPASGKRPIRVDYTRHISFIVHRSSTDQFLEDWCRIFNEHKQLEADQAAADYIRQNPDAYLSLWLLTHGAFRTDRARKTEYFKVLKPTLNRYQPYKELDLDLNRRRIPKKGEAFREFELVSQNGSVFNTKNVSNKVILLQFWSNSCAPCIKGMDDLVNLYKSLDTSKVQFISISLDDQKEKWLRSPVSKKIIWTSLWQENNLRCDLCLHYNLSAIPFFVMFSPDKKLHEIIEGEQLVGIRNELNVLMEKLNR